MNGTDSLQDFTNRPLTSSTETSILAGKPGKSRPENRLSDLSLLLSPPVGQRWPWPIPEGSPEVTGPSLGSALRTVGAKSCKPADHNTFGKSNQALGVKDSPEMLFAPIAMAKQGGAGNGFFNRSGGNNPRVAPTHFLHRRT